MFSSQEVSKNLTKENEQIKEDVEGIRAEMSKRGRENCSRDAMDSLPDVGAALQRDAAAAYAHPEVGPSMARAPSCRLTLSRVGSGHPAALRSAGGWRPFRPTRGPDRTQLGSGRRRSESHCAGEETDPGKVAVALAQREEAAGSPTPVSPAQLCPSMMSPCMKWPPSDVT